MLVLSFSNGEAALPSMEAADNNSSFVDIELGGSWVGDKLLSISCDSPVYGKPNFSDFFEQNSEGKHVQFNVGK